MRSLNWLGVALVVGVWGATALRAQETPPKAADTPAKPVESPFGPPPGMTKLGKEGVDVWIDTKRKLVVVDGEVCLTQGQLEMFACPRKTKEHESVIAVYSDAMTVHAALLAVGATNGSPVKFDPKFTPASGSIVDITILWHDKDKKPQKTPAQEWIRNVKTQKQMESQWVFGGSGFWTDETTGKRHYQADSGDLICVSNFNTATLDIPVESSQAAGDLLFEAFTDRIPPKGTKIRLVLAPRIPMKVDEKPTGKKAD